VRKATEVRPRLTEAIFQCVRCGTFIKEPQEERGMREPLECYEDQGGCKRASTSTKFKLISEESVFLDTQKIEIQERPEGMTLPAR
ncbi:MAG: ATPase, partial [Thermoplasmata archaeon]